jgi:hypothetical protein
MKVCTTHNLQKPNSTWLKQNGEFSHLTYKSTCGVGKSGSCRQEDPGALTTANNSHFSIAALQFCPFFFFLNHCKIIWEAVGEELSCKVV